MGGGVLTFCHSEHSSLTEHGRSRSRSLHKSVQTTGSKVTHRCSPLGNGRMRSADVTPVVCDPPQEKGNQCFSLSAQIQSSPSLGDPRLSSSHFLLTPFPSPRPSILGRLWSAADLLLSVSVCRRMKDPDSSSSCPPHT